VRLLPLLVLTACAPSFVDEPWLVTGPRLIAVVAQPPEVAPGGAAQLVATVAGQGAIAWSRCDTAAPLTQNEPVASSCLAALAGAAPGSVTFSLGVPGEACARFGPDVTQVTDRPRDPDATGGWYQPVGTSYAGQLAFAFERLSCEPAGVTPEVASAFRRARTPNQNPRLSVEARLEGAPMDFSALPLGQALTLVPTLDDPETYALIDPRTFELTFDVETRQVAWFVTDGELLPATTRAEPTTWRSPSTPGRGTLWVVARDSRGGLAVVVQPLAWQ
jgi:hypothetical protein